MQRSPVRFLTTSVMCLAALAAAAGSSAVHAVMVDFSGSVVWVGEDSGSGSFAGTGVGAVISGTFTYGDAAGAAVVFSWPSGNEKTWTFTDAAFGGSITNGTSTSVGSGNATVSILDDYALDAGTASVVSVLFGTDVAVGAPADIWTVGSIEDGAFFNAADELVGGMTFEFGAVSLDTALFGDLTYRAAPPASGTGAAHFFAIAEADASGAIVYQAIGRVESAPPPVPLPAAGWLLVSAIAAFGAAVRRAAPVAST